MFCGDKDDGFVMLQTKNDGDWVRGARVPQIQKERDIEMNIGRDTEGDIKRDIERYIERDIDRYRKRIIYIYIEVYREGYRYR